MTTAIKSNNSKIWSFIVAIGLIAAIITLVWLLNINNKSIDNVNMYIASKFEALNKPTSILDRAMFNELETCVNKNKSKVYNNSTIINMLTITFSKELAEQALNTQIETCLNTMVETSTYQYQTQKDVQIVLNAINKFK